MPNLKAQENLQSEENLQRFNYVLNPYRETKKTYESNSGKKLTIPDQSLSVKDIVQRFTRGQRIPDQMVGYYDEDNDPLGLEGTNIETLDLSQKYEILENVRRQNRHLKSRYEKQQKDEIERKRKEEILKEYEKTKEFSKPE